MLDRPFWQGRRVLLTGHTGSKGGWAAIWLDALLARQTLSWTDMLGTKDAIEWNATGYHAVSAGADLRSLTFAQIQAYESRFPAAAANSAGVGAK